MQEQAAAVEARPFVPSSTRRSSGGAGGPETGAAPIVRFSQPELVVSFYDEPVTGDGAVHEFGPTPGFGLVTRPSRKRGGMPRALRLGLGFSFAALVVVLLSVTVAIAVQARTARRRRQSGACGGADAEPPRNGRNSTPVAAREQRRGSGGAHSGGGCGVGGGGGRGRGSGGARSGGGAPVRPLRGVAEPSDSIGFASAAPPEPSPSLATCTASGTAAQTSTRSLRAAMSRLELLVPAAVASRLNSLSNGSASWPVAEPSDCGADVGPCAATEELGCEEV